MMRTLIYIIVFAAGLVFGGIFPGYIAQYQQRLDAQYEQLTVDLQPFRQIADRYHAGSMALLIEYHLASEDPTFYDEGLAIQKMLTNETRLAESRAAFESSLFRQAVFLYLDRDAELAKATWDAYTPAFVTTRDALVFAGSVGLIFFMMFYLSLALIRTAVRRMK
jgi:hypothetical protein